MGKYFLVLLVTDAWYDYCKVMPMERKLYKWESFIAAWEEQGVILNNPTTLQEIYNACCVEYYWVVKQPAISKRQLTATIIEDYKQFMQSKKAPIKFSTFIEKVLKPGYVEIKMLEDAM